MAMSFMWLLLTVTVTCMCASPRCKSSATSLSFSAYCQKLCMWGRGGNLCHCNAMHFVGKRRSVRQQPLVDDSELRPLHAGQQRNVDEQTWDDDDDALRAPLNDWLNDDENSTSDQSDGAAESAMWTRRRRRQPLFVALRRLDRRHPQLLRDSAKKGERHEPLMDDELTDDERRDVMTLNALTRKPMTVRLPPTVTQSDVLRNKPPLSRLPTPNLDAVYRMTK